MYEKTFFYMLGFLAILKFFLRMKFSDEEEVSLHVTTATAVASCKTFSKEAYGDTTFHSKDSTHG